MTTEVNPDGGSGILNTLYDISLDTEEEILAMSREQVQARLKEEGIDLTSTKAKLASNLQSIRGQQRLAEARERRLAQEELMAQRQRSVALDTPQMRAEVQQRLSILNPPHSPMVQVFFNRFKEASDDDLPDLLDDLKLLEEQNQEEE